MDRAVNPVPFPENPEASRRGLGRLKSSFSEVHSFAERNGINFFEIVYHLVAKIPRGKVATYGQIAAMISTPRAARIVGFALSVLPRDTHVPWQRVVNGKGMISIENLALPKSLQAQHLQKDGVEVKFKNGNYFVDLRKYLWKHT